MNQPNLFPDDRYEPPHVRHSSTSKAAAKDIKPSAATLRSKLWSWLMAHGPATDEEMQLGLPMGQNTQRPRRVELVRMGKVIATGNKSKTKSGKQAIVWQAVI